MVDRHAVGVESASFDRHALKDIGVNTVCNVELNRPVVIRILEVTHEAPCGLFNQCVPTWEVWLQQLLQERSLAVMSSHEKPSQPSFSTLVRLVHEA